MIFDFLKKKIIIKKVWESHNKGKYKSLNKKDGKIVSYKEFEKIIMNI